MGSVKGINFDREAKGTEWKYFARASAIEDKSEREEFTNYYLRRYWYTSNKQQAWWGTHNDGSGAYYGYWAFDTAAAVKAWGLDDAAFCDFKYYPKDMAHYLPA